MSDQRKVRTRFSLMLGIVREWLTHPLNRGAHARQDLYADLIRQASRTQSLEELLVQFPRRICSELQLESFHVFVLHQNDYVLRRPHLAPLTISASSSTVSRMKRERNPARYWPRFSQIEPDAWQLLAAPEELEILSSIGTHMLLPLEGRARLAGFVSLSSLSSRSFTTSELHFFRDLGPQLGRGLEAALLVEKLTTQAVREDRLEQELSLAREVQERLLPTSFPAFPGIDIAAFYQSKEQVGGDYYDIFETGTGQMGIVVADISGKGVSAALLMASLRATLRALMVQPDVPPEIVISSLNTLLYNASSSSRYATLFFALYDQVHHQLTYINAGHNPPILCRRDKSMERLTVGGPVVGLLPAVSLSSATVPMSAGDTLIAYTDGVTEAVDQRGNEWGESGLRTALRNSEQRTELSAQALIELIFTQLKGFTRGAATTDDITLVAMRLLP